MKTKIFNKILFTLLCLAAVNGTKAQQATPAVPAKPAEPATPATPYTYSDTNNSKQYRDKMRKLEDQMRDLQKQINSVRSEELKKNALAMRESSRKLKSLNKLNYSYNYETNVSGLSKSLGVISNDIGVNTVVGITGGDDYIAKRVQSGDAFEKTKSYSKSYSADGNDRLQLDNTFGKIIVNTWNKNEVKVDIQIKADADQEDEAQKLIDKVTIADSKDGSLISFKTNYDRDGNNNWGNWFGSGKSHVRKIEINYTVYMPAKMPLTVSNKYGSTQLPDLSGKLIINSSYGSLTAKNLSNSTNEIKVRYGSATIDNLSGSIIDVAYGNLNLGESDNLNADVSYGSAKIGKLTTSGNINARYSGTVQVTDVAKSVKNLSVNTSYSGVKLGIGNDQNADFDITVRYGSFSYGDVPVSITSKTPEDGERGFNPTKTYKGKVGKGNSDKVITIKSSFGSVKFD
ncbi:DUF4097 domain-containing protein [Mucilaginibacter agri]|uniref:Adhesin domain-containing protein n=1 Tax=Mucilaginibacter agri TaxID=2695265 RepID=A0A966DUD0_9SPHI|nr:DUF4097 domain-containing protein [Mucilaginibacter agri]NCD70282.1 hypothetical protein [Mucilaginibacter agri]